MNEYSLSDLAAVTGGNGAFGGNGLWLLIILFFLGGGNFGNRAGDFGQYATAASQQEMLFGQRFSNLDTKMDKLGNGIADATFTLNNTIVAEGRATADKLCQLNTAVHSEGEQTRAMLQQNKIESLQARINQLELAQATGGVPRISPYMYNVTPNCGCNCGTNF